MLKYIKIANCIGIYVRDDGYYAQFENAEPRLVTTAEILAATKLQKIDELKLACTTAIQAGFTSSALGSPHTYDSALPQDQTNLLGARLAGIDMDFTCTDADGYKSQKFHTVAQLAQVYLDGMEHLQTQKAKFYARKASVESASTVEAVNGVSW